MTKAYRQRQILEIVRRTSVHTQEELAAELRAAGVDATQVTLSRDIRELGLAKTPAGYRQIEAPPPRQFGAIVTEFLEEIRVAQHLLVLKTSPANASSLASALDHENWPEIVGTIAGDDTVLVVAPDATAAQQLKERLLRLLTQ